MTVLLSKIPHILYGADYNPEQWPEEVWLEDARLMQEAGVNLVSLGIFAWSHLQPTPERFDFLWLDRVIDILFAHNIFIDLATATASPPAWLARQHPESLPQRADGTILGPGSRQQYCPSSPAYRAAAAELVRRLAERYKNHPALALWHINNEYGCHVPACYCDISAAAFRGWLKQRYNSLDRLNHAWGTAFWSQRYADWAEVTPPRTTPTFINPTQQLDFQRFSSYELMECFRLERAILKEVTPDVPITTNFMGFFKPADYWQWAQEEDIVSNDSYPDPGDPQAHIQAAATSDLMRSLSHGRPWLLLEQTPSQTNWRLRNVLKRPGQMRLWTYQAVAHGADGALFFQWRASAAGGEKFHGGMIPHVGIERSRVWNEVVALGTELHALDELIGSTVNAEVAILLDWESWWAMEGEAKPSADLQQMDCVHDYYHVFYENNITVDFVGPDSDLSGYRIVCVPNLYLTRGDIALRLERFVHDGGTLVMSFFSGIVDEQEHILLGGYPAPFRSMLGLRVEEFDPYTPTQRNCLVVPDGKQYRCSVWSDVIQLEGAEALATYAHDFYRGQPAVTRHRFGSGLTYYLGTRPESAYMEQLLLAACQQAGISRLPAVPAGIEVMRRSHEADTYLFLLNHSPKPHHFPLDISGVDLLTGAVCDGTLSLEPYGVAIVKGGRMQSVPSI